MDPAQLADTVDRVTHRWMPTVLRWTAGLLWLSNVSWKVAPDFGRTAGRCGSLCHYFEVGSEHPVLPGSGWVFEHLFSPQLTLVGWVTVLVEATLVALLLSGRHLRVAAVLGASQSAGIGLAVANGDGEWYWSYALMVALHLAILFAAPATRRPGARSVAGVVALYGAVVALTHAGAGFTGDENRTWSLFDQRNDFPGDFGRNVFPGSIALGLILIAVGVVAVVGISRLTDGGRVAAGWVLTAVSLIVLVSIGVPRTTGYLGIRSSSAAVLAALGIALLSDRGHPSAAADEPAEPDDVPAR